MKRRAGSILRSLEDTGVIQGAESMGGSDTWPTTTGEWRLRLGESREGSFLRIDRNC